jgi:hypothetical protein
MPEYAHLRIQREEPINERRPGKPQFGRPPQDVRAHAIRLQERLEAARDTSDYSPGFDNRLLLKIQLDSRVSPDLLESVGGTELISQEAGGVVLAFADEQAIEVFEARLATMRAGERVTRQQLLYALQSFDHWTPEDRKGWALRRDGFPQGRFYVDVELWPVRRQDDRTALVAHFRDFITAHGMRVVDQLDRDFLILCRVEASPAECVELLKHRDVRTVDLVPRFSLEPGALLTDVADLPAVASPDEQTPFIAVLDSGVNAGHPLIGPAIADVQGFLQPDRLAADENGHGTHIAGIALYGDVQQRLSDGSFVPMLRLLSGRILDENNEADPRLIESVIDEAVRYFHTNYGCRVFNLSYGDKNKPFLGGRIRWLAFMLDSLARELDILFVVPTGNFNEATDVQLRDQFAEYLLTNDAAMLDPAPALNVITVGSIARFDANTYSTRYKQDPRMRPVAQRDQPSPFTRTATSSSGAIKPDLVAYGGNLACHATVDGNTSAQGMGELSTSSRFVEGRFLEERSGTSCAAPHVAHYAARLLHQLPVNSSANLLRALLIASARIPTATTHLLNDDEKLARTVGYGLVDPGPLLVSTDTDVALIAEEALPDKLHHFYELPLPDEFISGSPKSRTREITIAIAHCPPVRTTRIDYKGVRMSFKVVAASSLHDVSKMFNKSTPKEEYKAMPEWSGGTKLRYGAIQRSRGTVQGCTWQITSKIRKKLFVVVTRNDQGWLDQQEPERYALVVQYKDRENIAPQLYDRLNAVLRARERSRARVRL